MQGKILPKLCWPLLALLLSVSTYSCSSSVPPTRMVTRIGTVIEQCSYPIFYFAEPELAPEWPAIAAGFDRWNEEVGYQLFAEGAPIPFEETFLTDQPYVYVRKRDLDVHVGLTNLRVSPGGCVIGTEVILTPETLSGPYAVAVTSHEAGHVLGLADKRADGYYGIMYYRVRFGAVISSEEADFARKHYLRKARELSQP